MRSQSQRREEGEGSCTAEEYTDEKEGKGQD
jgi:hypothetical protein